MSSQEYPRLVFIVTLLIVFMLLPQIIFLDKILSYFELHDRPLHDKDSENDGKNSRAILFPDKETSKNCARPLNETSREDGNEDCIKFIFINSYMRSGSTFLGRLLGHRNDTFYFYEPLHELSKLNYTKGSKICDIRELHCEYRYDALEKRYRFLSDVFNCRLQEYSGIMKLNLIERLSGMMWSPLRNCLIPGEDIKGCLAEVEKNCLPTKNRVVKVLRMALEDAALLLPKHPNLAIVHLFRDPRGTFNSHIHTGWFPMQTKNISAFVNDIKAHCERITEDLAIGKTLITMYPGRVTLLQYEDIYGNVEKAKKLYKLLDMEFLESDMFNKTLHRQDDGSVTEYDYLSGPFMYRTRLPFEFVRIIDDICKDALEMLGLKSYKSETELGDIDFNPFDGKLPFEL